MLLLLMKDSGTVQRLHDVVARLMLLSNCASSWLVSEQCLISVRDDLLLSNLLTVEHDEAILVPIADVVL